MVTVLYCGFSLDHTLVSHLFIGLYVLGMTVSGATLEIITDKSQEGAQFVKGFGGSGGEHMFLFVDKKQLFM